MLLLLPSLAAAEGLAIKDGELANEHLDLSLTPDQLRALQTDSCPREELTLSPEQRALLAAKTGTTIAWVRAKPAACWTDCTCAENNLGLVNGARLSVELRSVRSLRVSDTFARAFEKALETGSPSPLLSASPGDPAPPTAAETQALAALRAAAPALLDRQGTVVTDALGTYQAISVAFPAGATRARVKARGGDLYPLWENELALPLRRAELVVTAQSGTGDLRWPDSAVLPDRVLLAALCSHEAAGDYPCFVDLRYDGDHLVSAVQIDPTMDASVFSAVWSGDTLRSATAEIWGSWHRWSGLAAP